MPGVEFEQLIGRLRNGDQAAASELVGKYESEVRRFVRFRLTTPAIRRFVDSLDISQSVLGRFFVELREGKLDVSTPGQLRNLLLTMARNKLYDQARKELAEKRDATRVEEYGEGKFVDHEDSVSENVADTEFVNVIRTHLSDDERYLIDQRMTLNRSWEDIASELNSTPDAVRKRMTRAIDRVAGQLGVI